MGLRVVPYKNSAEACKLTANDSYFGASHFHNGNPSVREAWFIDGSASFRVVLVEGRLSILQGNFRAEKLI